MINRKRIILIFLLILLCYIFCFYSPNRAEEIKRIIINNKEIRIEIANTDQEQYKGLSGRKKLCADCGMIFVYNDKAVRNFVMREMNFNLDILWIDDDKIVEIDKDLPAEGANPAHSYSSGESVNYVLEVNAGFCDGNGIKKGDKIKIDI